MAARGCLLPSAWSPAALSGAAALSTLQLPGLIAGTGPISLQAEQVTITAVTANRNGGSSVAFEPALQYKHFGEILEFGSKSIDMRGEVGVLSRTVKLRGDDDSERLQWGAHIFMHSPDGADSTTGRLSYVECEHCGQAFQLGRYPFHFHMIGALHNSYVQGCAIHHTFNRAITLHGSHYLRILDNIGYDTMGHTFFIEDGAETYNRVEGNLGLVTRKSFSLLDTDTTPASFWITNPTNYFRNNVAAGSSRYGFWFDLDSSPNGPSYTPDVCPNQSPLLEFSNNRAHSNARYALRIFHGYHPRADPCKASDPIPAVFQDFTAFKNTRSGVIGSNVHPDFAPLTPASFHQSSTLTDTQSMIGSDMYLGKDAGDREASAGWAACTRTFGLLRGSHGRWIGYVRFEGFRLADNQRAGIEITDASTNLGEAGSWDTLLVAHTDNQEWPMPQEDNPSGGRVTGIFGAQSENVTHHDTLFVNYDVPNGPSSYGQGEVYTAALSSCNHCDFPNTMCSGGKTVHLSASSWINSDVRVAWGTPSKGIFHDIDGTLGIGAAGSHVSAHWNHLEEGCEAAPAEWPKSLVCAPEVKGPKRLEVSGFTPFKALRYYPLSVAALPGDLQDYGDDLVWPHPNASGLYSWSKVPYKDNMWHEPADGWAIALLHGHTYALHVSADDYATDLTSMTLNVQHLQPGEHLYIKINYTNPYDHWKVYNMKDGDTEILSSVVSEPDSSGTTGQSYTDKDNQVLTVLFSGTDQEGAGTYASQVVKLESDMCPRSGCPAPPVITVEKETFTRKWSNASQWPGGIVPAAGEKVTIEPAWRMWLDVQPASLAELAIQGELHFDEEVCGIVLEAVNIIVGGGGELRAGSSSAHYPCDATVRLTGDRASPWVNIADVDVGNKALANFGIIQLHGIPRPITRVMLAAVAKKGTSEVVLDQSTDWQVGESILITSSSNSQSETEMFTIKEKNGLTLTIEGALEYGHFGAPQAVIVKGRPVEVRAEVALVSRNVMVEGSQNNDEHGCHFITSSYEDDDGNRVEGTLQMTNVVVRNCGQYGTTHNAVSLKDPQTHTANIVESCAVLGSHNTAIFLLQASKTILRNNAIYSSRGSSVDIDESDSVILTGNLAAYTYPRGAGTPLIEMLANFDVCTRTETNGQTAYCTDVEVKNNVAAGSGHFGFLHKAETCGEATGFNVDSGAFAKRMFSGNRAHSTPNGVWILPGQSSSCSYLSDMTVHHTTETGVFYGQAMNRLELQNLTLADNTIGVYACPPDSGHPEMVIKDLVLVGLSGSTWDMQLGQGSCPGARSGMMAPILNGAWALPRQQPLMLYDDAVGDGGWGGTLHMSDVEMVNWTLPSSCAEDGAKRFGAVSTNPKAPDSLMTMFIKDVTGSTAGTAGLVWMDNPNPSWQNPEDCVDADCTGLLNVVLHDLDGSLIGAEGQLYGPNQLVGSADDRCKFHEAWNAYACPGADYDTLYMESLDADTYSRRFTPVKVWNEETGLRNSMFPQMDHRWDNGYTSNLRWSRFPIVLDLGKAYNLTCTGTNPRDVHLALPTDSDETGVILHIWQAPHPLADVAGCAAQAPTNTLEHALYQSPELHEVFVNGKKKEAVQSAEDLPWDKVKLSQDTGTHYWYNPKRILTILVKGQQDIIIRTVNAVQLELTVIGTIDEFYDNGGLQTFTANLAYSLSIEPSRIKVVDIVSGVSRKHLRRALLETNTTNLEVLVSEEKSEGAGEEDPDAAEDAVVAELELVAERATQQAEAGTLLSDFTVTEYTVELSVPPEDPCMPSCQGTGVCNDGTCTCGEGEVYFSTVTDLDEMYGSDDGNVTKESGCYAEDESGEEASDDGGGSDDTTVIIVAVVCSFFGIVAGGGLAGSAADVFGVEMRPQSDRRRSMAPGLSSAYLYIKRVDNNNYKSSEPTAEDAFKHSLTMTKNEDQGEISIEELQMQLVETLRTPEASKRFEEMAEMDSSYADKHEAEVDSLLLALKTIGIIKIDETSWAAARAVLAEGRWINDLEDFDAAHLTEASRSKLTKALHRTCSKHDPKSASDGKPNNRFTIQLPFEIQQIYIWNARVLHTDARMRVVANPLLNRPNKK
eukprot:gene5761-6952_t